MTEAEFLRFLRHGGSKVTVIAEIEFAYESGGSLTTGTIYLADRPDAVTGSQPYRDAIMRAPELERAIDLTLLGGRGSRTLGSLSLNNADGTFDYLLDAIIDGRDCALYIGGQGWDRADYRQLGVGTVGSVSAPTDGEIVIQLRDKNYLLDDTLIGDTITTGPNAGKPKPILLGHINNFDITPYLFDASALKYYINNFAMDGLLPEDVRDAGESLRDGIIFSFTSASMSINAATDTLTRTTPHGLAVNDVLIFEPLLAGASLFGLAADTQYWVIAAGLTANDFRLSLTKGGAAVDLSGVMSSTWDVVRQRYYVDATAATIELSASPAGRVTLDMTATDAAGVLGFGHPHRIFRYLLQNHTKLTASEYDDAAIGVLIAAEIVEAIPAGFAVLDRMNVLALLDQIAQSTYSWYGWNSDGVLTVGRLDLANLDAATPIDDITAAADVMGHLSADNMPLAWGKMSIDVTRNVVVQTDGLVDNVSAGDRSLWAQPFQLRSATTDLGFGGYLSRWWIYHKSAIDSKPQPLCLDVGIVVAQEVVDTMTDLFKPWTRVHRCTVGLDKYALNPGDCVSVTYPRYGLDAGKNCRVISVRPRLSDRQVDLVLVRQAIPDYTTAVH